jgi:hypothetical protein
MLQAYPIDDIDITKNYSSNIAGAKPATIFKRAAVL